jgi:HSP20 family protein
VPTDGKPEARREAGEAGRSAPDGSVIGGGCAMPLLGFAPYGFDPFAELRRMQSEMNRLFSGVGATVTREFPPINLWLGDNSVVVTAELPGVGRDDVSLSLIEDVLTLEGERRPHDESGARWHRRERGYGSFARTIQLPFRVDPGNVQARFNNGILEIELQRPPEDRPKKIEIRTA